MLNTQDLDALVNKLAGMLPQGESTLGKDLKKNLRALLDASFRDMDLVSREEYEVQKALLIRTRERLDRLQARLDQLEKAD